MMAKDNDVGFRPFDYYNPELLPLTAHTTFRYPEDKKDLVEKARKMAGSKGLNGLQLELLEEFVVR